eukprot:scaffold451_cov365-Prasinococcus_capsulatus_cf.AAC.33
MGLVSRKDMTEENAIAMAYEQAHSKSRRPLTTRPMDPSELRLVQKPGTTQDVLRAQCKESIIRSEFSHTAVVGRGSRNSVGRYWLDTHARTLHHVISSTRGRRHGAPPCHIWKTRLMRSLAHGAA